MSPPRAEYEEHIARNVRAERGARGDFWRDLLRTALHLAFWVMAGFSLIAFSAHTTNQEIGKLLFMAGQLVWLSGVLFALLAAYRRGEKRGDW